jgi:hypothetical protein
MPASTPSPDLTPTPVVPAYVDYFAAAARAGIGRDDLAAIVRLFERDYPHDVMLRELHVLRACHAVERGVATVRSILSAATDRAA